MDDLEIGAIVLKGDANWQDASLSLKVRVVLFGDWRGTVHLGRRAIVSWWRDEPYLIHFSEVG